MEKRDRTIAATVITGLFGIAAAIIGAHLGAADRQAEQAAAPAPPSVVPTARDAGFPPGMVGTWSGELLQSDGKRWPVEIRIGSDTAATVSYARPGCSGSLTPVGTVGPVVDVRERITSGTDRCTDTGTGTLRQPGPNELEYVYRPDGAAYTGTAVLSRTVS
ncbi:hypothetical protein Val02_09840 [Virgisporangium aliadipatigenens]|uniref:Uncharacterized protein n=1 Tax=Virgisporangium aliadipatigenens TaxID=741659 RepID=A0A8J4DP02_9ACTN|nr:hypothetical protein [Virgisporangium aliadipatigenens]GIJ44098.1 hypothetical protein Val02_09840 [Virgisporangium aliadipatigenens]